MADVVAAIIPYGIGAHVAAAILAALADRFPDADVRNGQDGLEILVDEEAARA